VGGSEHARLRHPRFRQLRGKAQQGGDRALRFGEGIQLQEDVGEIVQHPDVRRIGLARFAELLARPGEFVRLPALRRLGAQHLRAQPAGPIGVLRRHLGEALVDGNRLLEPALLHEQTGESAQRGRLVRHGNQHFAQIRLRFAGPAALEHEVGERQARVPALLWHRAVDGCPQRGLRIVVATLLPGDARVAQPGPEDHALELSLPDVASVGNQPAGALEELARLGEVLVALRLRRLLLGDQRQTEPGVGIGGNRTEVGLGSSEIVAVERREP